MPRKTAAKDANGGKLGQFTTEVKKTIEKARLDGMEEQKKISRDFFMPEIERIRALYEIRLGHYKERIEWYKTEVLSSKRSVIAGLLVGVVIGSALMGLLMSV